MAGTFFGLNIAASGLRSNQTAMNVIGHNIANANNPNFRRQQAVIVAGPAFPYGGGGGNSAGAGQLGSGSDVATIRRLKDQFVDAELLGSTRDLGKWEAGSGVLGQLEGIIGEPSDSGLGSALDQFWNSWQELSLSPQSSAARSNLLEYGGYVSNSLNRLHTQIQSVQSDINLSISSKVGDINRLSSQLASINQQIQRTLGDNQNPNDLMDQRDAIVSDLSKMADIQVFGQGGASDIITLGGHALVQGVLSNEIKLGKNANGQDAILWSSDSSEVTINGGELSSLQAVQRDVVPNYLSTLDDIANALITRVNAVHAAGYGLTGLVGTDFFSGTSAADIKVNQELLDDPRLIAAATSNAIGDGSNALAISRVRTEVLIGSATIGDTYNAFVAQNAFQVRDATNRLTAQNQVHQQLQAQQQSFSGVSLDEELSDMIRFQQAYSASARFMSVMDDMLTTLVGLAGR